MRGERGGEVESRESDLSKMVTFINMVITKIKNWSPDMTLTAFDKKFDEKQK